jgi:hypothetical protein
MKNRCTGRPDFRPFKVDESGPIKLYIGVLSAHSRGKKNTPLHPLAIRYRVHPLPQNITNDPRKKGKNP